jgi:hypothetical protein
MSASTRFRELIDSAKAEVRSWFGHGHATAEEAIAKLDEVQAAVDADAGPLEHDAAQDAESAGHDAEEAAAPLEAEAEHEAKALAEDAEHDSAAIVADVHERPQAAPVPPAAVPSADEAAGSGDASGLEH